MGLLDRVPGSVAVMTRVVAGAARGRRLAVPSGRGTRPTSDRAREGLFSSLASLRGDIAGGHVLDLYAGSGAVGLEALSRGAAHVLLVEAHAGAAQVIRDNARTLALRGAAVLACPVERLVAGSPTAGALARGVRAPYDIAFLDPPYDLEDTKVRAVLDGLRAHGWLTEAAVVVVERATRGGVLAWPAGYQGDRSRRYGEATLWYGHAAPLGSAP
jgi:16S rRNA (guanine966-N2)-methyltransferase